MSIYTIGVGRQDGREPEINPALLRSVATRPDMFFNAPDARQLAGIYQRLSREIPCGGQATWPRRG
jgi:hypothetical protein